MQHKAYNRSNANRGMQLERLIEATNLAYAYKGLASVVKQHPEITVLQLKGNQITRGFFKEKGVPDYIGILQSGQAIVFDAKETKETTRFPLKNVHHHQYELLKTWHEKGAHAFLLIAFSAKRYETYLMPFEHLQEAWEGFVGDGKKSVSYHDIVEKCLPVKTEAGYTLHYLKHLIGG